MGSDFVSGVFDLVESAVHCETSISDLFVVEGGFDVEDVVTERCENTKDGSQSEVSGGWWTVQLRELTCTDFQVLHPAFHRIMVAY